MIFRDINGARQLGSALACVIAFSAAATLLADAPSWWQTRGVLQTNAVPNDYAALNVGQLKQIAFSAWQELEFLPGGAGFQPTFTNATNNYAAVNIGQLKAVARPFYDRLISLERTSPFYGRLMASGLGTNYPWANSPSTNNYAIANIGQAKKLFSFEPGPEWRDSDDDGLSDLAELTWSKIYAWGYNSYGQCNVPAAATNVIAIAAGLEHSLALRTNGTVVAWGSNDYGQTNIPAAATNVIAVSAGERHSLVLRADGRVVAWGSNDYGQTNVPTSVTNAIAVAAGGYHSLALCADGAVVAWGYNSYGQCNVPTCVTNAIAVAAGGYHSLALCADGAVVAWGYNVAGQTNVPACVTNAIAVAAGSYHSLALLADGRVVAWGYNDHSETDVPFSAINGVIATGYHHGLALCRLDPLNPDMDGDGLPDGWEVRAGLDPFRSNGSSGDSDGDGFLDGTEFCTGTDPAFSVDAVTSSQGRHILKWTEIPGAINYLVKVSFGGSERTYTTNGCLIVIKGDFKQDTCSVQVSAYDPALARVRMASTTFQQPSQADRKSWKISDPFMFRLDKFPYLIDVQPFFFERTFEICQDTDWPRQFFLSSNGDATSGFLSSLGVSKIEVSDDTGCTDSLTLGGAATTALPYHLNVGSTATKITVRFYVDKDYIRTTRSAVSFDMPLYLIGCRPEIVFANTVPSYDLIDGTELLTFQNGAIPFTVKYDGCPTNGISMASYFAPFGNILPYEKSPRYDFENGLLTGGELPIPAPDRMGAYTIGGEPPPPGSASDKLRLILCFLNFEPERDTESRLKLVNIRQCSVHRDYIDICKGEFPLDSSCLYNAMLNGLLCDSSYEEGEYVDVETSFSYPGGFPGSEYLQYEPQIHVWGYGEWSTNVQAKFIYMGTTNIIGSEVVERTGEEEPEDFVACAGYNWEEGCGCSSCSCDNTSECIENPELHSVGFRIPLGFTGYKTLSGLLWFNVKSNQVVVSPSMFSIMSNSTVEASFVTNTLTVGCSLPGGRKVIVGPFTNGVIITIYNNWADASPARCWTITNDNGCTNKVHFIKYDGASTNSPVGIDQLFECTDGVWSRLDNRTKRHESLTETVAGGETTTIRQVCEGGPQGKILSKTKTVSRIIPAGTKSMSRDVASAEWDGITESWRETTMSYWDGSTGGSMLVGLPKFRQSPDGSWEYRSYDVEGREILRVQSRNASVVPAVVNSPLPASLGDFANAAGLYATVTVSGYAGAENELPSAKRKPRSIASYEIQSGTGTILTGWEWHNYTEETANGYAVVCHRVERAVSQNLAWWKGNPANFISISRSYADDPSLANRAPMIRAGRPISSLSADGSLTRWEYLLNAAETSLIITTRHGTTNAPNGVAYRSTYEVETLDSLSGKTVTSETRLYTAGGVNPDPVLSSVVNVMDSNGRVLKTLYSDGTSISNVWGCCKIDETIGRDGIKSSSSTVTRNGALVTVSAQQWMASLPGSQERYTVTESSSDALGRETNTTVYVCYNGAADFDYEPLTTLTFYPYGTSNYRVSVSPSGMETVSSSYSSGGWEVDETSSAGVTSVVRRISGGGLSVSERFWTDTLTGQPAWSRETTTNSWLSDGRKVETTTSEASDREGATVTSRTTYDFLGRVIETQTPLGTSSSFYQATRLVRSSRTGMPDTRYVYDDATGEVRDTVVDVNGNGYADYAGSDRISRSESCYVILGSDWWRESTSLVWNQEGSATPLVASVSRERITGLGTPAPEGYAGVLTAQSQSVNVKGGATTSSTYTYAQSNRVWQFTNVPGSGIAAVSLSMGGQTLYTKSSTGIESSLGYDGFGRQTTFTDGRNNTSVTHYNSLGQVDFAEDAASNRTCFAYDSLGRKVAQTFLSADGSLSNATYTAYDVLGQPLATWGATYPVAYEYDLAGRMTSMYTYRGTNETEFVNTIMQSGINAIRQFSDRTQWLYEPVTGLLTNKLYADGNGPSYNYTSTGKLQTRTWARGVVTEYGYDSLGQLVSVQYSDGTPSVTNTYDRLGRKLSATTSVSTNTFEYTGLELNEETQNTDTILRESRELDGKPTRLVLNYWTESFAYHYWWSYDGRLFGTEFGDRLNYSWVESVYSPGIESQTGVEVYDRLNRYFAYEPLRDVITNVYNYGVSGLVSSYSYDNDALGRRTNRVDITPSLTANNAFGYNLKSEVTSAMYPITQSGTNAIRQFSYDYDPIGNRIQSAVAVGSGQSETNTYTANALNQYSSLQPKDLQPINLTYDFDGNMLTNGVWSYTWDAENRLVSACSNGVLLITNRYDDQSRRILKSVFEITESGTNAIRQSSFVYDGWNPIRERITDNGSLTTKYFCWGPDLSGTPQGAGGVGGLQAIIVGGEIPATYYPCYDANGNITAYVDELGFARAEYAYDAFGNTISQSGDLASTFSHRFSTKYADDESGLYYYGYRYYAPELGRWVNRDPIEEQGGVNLYGFVGNNGINMTDYLGRFEIAPVNDSPSAYYFDTNNKTGVGYIYASVFIILSAKDLERIPNGGLIVHGKRVTIDLRDKDGKSVIKDTQAVTKAISVDSKGLGRPGYVCDDGRSRPPNYPSTQDGLLENITPPIYYNLLARGDMNNCMEGEVTIKANWYLYNGRNKYYSNMKGSGGDTLSGSLDGDRTHGSMDSTPGWPKVDKGYIAAGSYYVTFKISRKSPYFLVTMHYANPLWKDEYGFGISRKPPPEGGSYRGYSEMHTKW